MIRPSFVDVLRERLLEKKPLIQFVIGPRQVGKTTGVELLLADYQGPVHSVLAEETFGHSHLWLREQWQKTEEAGPRALLVIDEIQKIEKWSETVKFLWDKSLKAGRPLKCVFLGSSNLHIHKGLSESLAGRFELIEVPHWDFEETKKLVPMKFEDYLRFGGYPGSYRFLNDESRWRQYLRQSILENVLTKDILPFAHVRKPALFRQTVELLLSYPAQVISYTKLLGQLQESGNAETVKSYMQLLEFAFLVKGVEKFSNKKHLAKASSPKIIPLSPALITAFHPEAELGRRFEAYVGQCLLRREGDLSYWREGINEVDFIYRHKKRLYAIEVKSGRKKSSRGLDAFTRMFPESQPLFIDFSNVHRLDQLLA